MSGTLNGRGIRIAIAVSLAVHLVIAILVHPRRVEAQPPEKPTPALVIHLIAPTPKPVPHIVVHNQVRRAPQVHRPRFNPPRLPQQHNDGKSVAIALPTAAPGTPAPSGTGSTGSGPDTVPTDEPLLPTPTPKPACSAPDVPARTTFVQSPDVPDRASQPATAKIRVDLDAAGEVRSVSVYESTGSMELDRAALAAARESHYAPEEHDCQKIAGSYLFTVDFSE